MIRDELNSDARYQEITEQINGFISKSVLKIKNLQLDEVNGIQNHPKSNKAIINSTQWRLFNDYFDLLRTNYSIGKPLEELSPIYLNALEYFTKSWKAQS